MRLRWLVSLTPMLLGCSSGTSPPAPPTEPSAPVAIQADHEATLRCEDVIAQRDALLADARYARAAALLKRTFANACPHPSAESARIFGELMAEFGDPELARKEAARLDEARETESANAIRGVLARLAPKAPVDPAAQEAVLVEYERAAEAYHAQNFQEALAGFERVWNAWHPFPEASIGAGLSLIALGREREGRRRRDRAGGEASIESAYAFDHENVEPLAASPTGRVVAGGLVVDTLNERVLCQVAGRGDGYSFDASGTRIGQWRETLDAGSGAREQRLAVYHALSGRRLTEHALPASPYAPAWATRAVTRFSPDGKRLAFLAYDIGVVDLETGKAEFIPPRAGAAKASTIEWAPDGRLLAVGWSEAVELWNVSAKPKKQRTFPVQGAPLALRFTRGGASLVAGTVSERVLSAWNIQTGALERTMTRRHPPASVELSDDGAQIAFIDDGLQIWDVAENKLALRVPAPQWEGLPRYAPDPIAPAEHAARIVFAGKNSVVWDCGPTTCTSGAPDAKKNAAARPIIGHAPSKLWAHASAERGNALVQIDEEERALIWDFAQGQLHVIQLDLGCAAHRVPVVVRPPAGGPIQVTEPMTDKDPRMAVKIENLAPDASSFRVRGCERDHEVTISDVAYAGHAVEAKLGFYALEGIAAGVVVREGRFDFVGPDGGAPGLGKQFLCRGSRPGPLGRAELPQELCSDWFRVPGIMRAEWAP